MVTESLKEVEKKVEEACKRAGRERSEVTLIAVGKTKPVDALPSVCGGRDRGTKRRSSRRRRVTDGGKRTEVIRTLEKNGF